MRFQLLTLILKFAIPSTLASIPYFHVIPIHCFTPSKMPCIFITIEEKELLLGLDSGFWGYVGLNEKILDQIQEKQFLKEISLFGMNGQYFLKSYNLPRTQIGPLSLKNIVINELPAKLLLNLSIQSGLIGWRSFEESNLLLDIPNQLIAIADSIETLQKNGYFRQEFIKIPLSHSKSFISLEIDSLHCCLDTGTTFNLLHSNELKNNLSALYTKNFGEIFFLLFPIKIPKGPDAILGMDFLSCRTVFINFHQKTIYISTKNSL